MTLSLRISATIAAILALVMGLAAFLNYTKYEHAYLDLLQSRLMVVGESLRETVETGLNLGLTLGEMAGFQAVIERELERDANLLSIEIFNLNGQRLFATGELDDSPTVPESHIRQSAGLADWRAQDDHALIVGLPLTNPFGQPVGGLVIRYSRSYYQSELNAVIADLGRCIFLILGTVTLATGLLTALILRNFNRHLKNLEQELAEFTEAGGIPGKATAVDDELEQGVARFKRIIRQALAEIDAASGPAAGDRDAQRP